MSKALLYDATHVHRLQAVRAGVRRPKQALPTTTRSPPKSHQSDHKYTVVLTKGEKFMRRLCMNCEDPACASVCPVGALRKDCRSAPSPTTKLAAWDAAIAWRPVPSECRNTNGARLLPKVQKCTMCPDRVQAGQATACAEVCPTGATKFGDRDELIAEAQATHPRQSRQIRQPHLWAERSRRHLRPAALERAFRGFGYPHRPDATTRCPFCTYRVLSRIPDFVPLGGMLLGGIWWITHRREEVAEAEEPTRKDTEMTRKDDR